MCSQTLSCTNRCMCTILSHHQWHVMYAYVYIHIIYIHIYTYKYSYTYVSLYINVYQIDTFSYWFFSHAWVLRRLTHGLPSQRSAWPHSIRSFVRPTTWCGELVFFFLSCGCPMAYWLPGRSCLICSEHAIVASSVAWGIVQLVMRGFINTYV